jgi:predicted phosphoribosyltransferase
MDFFEKPFRDREDAGRQLAANLKAYRLPPETVVLGLPRGGVVVAYQVAEVLNFQLDVFVVRKLGVPGQEEFAMGAIASGGVTLLNQETIKALNISKEQVEHAIQEEQKELGRREQLYRCDQSELDVHHRAVVVVDDGLATGSTMLAAVTALRQKHPRYLMVAIPVAAEETCAELKTVADDTVCLATPDPFYSVGAWYQNFVQTSDKEVKDLLQQARADRGSFAGNA